MAGKKQANPYVVQQVLQKGWDYLNQNFQNFSTTQKIHIALELCKKSMPDNVNLNGDINITVHQVLSEGENRIENYLASRN